MPLLSTINFYCTFPSFYKYINFILLFIVYNLLCIAFHSYIPQTLKHFKHFCDSFSQF